MPQNQRSRQAAASYLQPEKVSAALQGCRSLESEYRRKGAGLGLTNTQNIILNHKGNIDVSSTVGEGTIFTVSLLLED